MKIRYLILWIFFISLLQFQVIAKEKRTISLDYAMCMAEKNSSSLSAAKFYEIAARKSIDVAKAAYYPTLNAEAIDSVGFTGSCNALGIEGLMGSPFRKGAAGGVVAEQIIYDFGRTFYNVEIAKRQAESSHQNTRVTAYQIKQLTLQIYYECAKFRTLQNIWSELSKESAIVTKEALHFVDTGQVSIVDRYLSQAETEEALTAKAFFAEQMEHSIYELAVLMGTPPSFTCPILPHNLPASLNPNTPIEQSPILWHAIAEAKVAHVQVKEAKAGFMPKIIAVASTGDMQGAVLVKRQDFAAGIGIIFPLFDLNTYEKIQHAKAVEAAKKQDICAQKIFLKEANAKYDRIIYSSEVRLQHLSNELRLARTAFKIAKDRYFTLQGNLIDLREAYRNLSRVEVDVENTLTLLLQAKGSKALLNNG